MEIKNVDINSIFEYEKNPRKNDKAVDKVAQSIKEFGFKVPIVVDKNNVIITGHTRLKASKKLGLKEVPVLVANDLNEKQVQAYRIADNKTNELSDWDFELLEQELKEIEGMFTGFDELEIDKLFGSDGSVVEDDYEVKPPKVAKSQLGDIYQLGRHRLMCGDSTKVENVEKLMDGKKVDLFITDPPYNVNYQGGTVDEMTIQNDNMNNTDFRQFLLEAFASADNVMKKGAVFYIWHADSEGYNFRGACFENGWQVRQCLIWSKSSLVMGRQDYHWMHEPCLYGWKDGASHLWASDRTQTTILHFDKPKRNAEHPTMKPLLLFDYQIKNNTKPEDIVLDTFGGSGTTIMACEQNGRNAYMMELDPIYIDVIINRWETFTGEKAILLNR